MDLIHHPQFSGRRNHNVLKDPHPLLGLHRTGVTPKGEEPVSVSSKSFQDPEVTNFRKTHLFKSFLTW
jgi:hypothetical protein